MWEHYFSYVALIWSHRMLCWKLPRPSKPIWQEKLLRSWVDCPWPSIKLALISKPSHVASQSIRTSTARGEESSYANVEGCKVITPNQLRPPGHSPSERCSSRTLLPLSCCASVHILPLMPSLTRSTP